MSDRDINPREQLLDRVVIRLIDAGVHVIDLGDLVGLGVASSTTALDVIDSIERVGESRGIEMAGLAMCSGRRFAIERVDPKTADFTVRFDDAVRRRLQARIASMTVGTVPARYYGTHRDSEAKMARLDSAVVGHCGSFGCHIARVIKSLPPVYCLAYGDSSSRGGASARVSAGSDGGKGTDANGN